MGVIQIREAFRFGGLGHSDVGGHSNWGLISSMIDMSKKLLKKP